MVLVLDNYDSFTYNLVQYLGELKADVLVHRNDEGTVEQIESENPERILVSPGPCTPREAGLSNEVIIHFGGKLPIMGVCLGHQCIAVAYGATVVSADEIVHGKLSVINHDGQGVCTGLGSQIEAIRYHSLAIAPHSGPDDLLGSATTNSGVIMGVRHRTFPVEGIQFHPESILTRDGKEILKNFAGDLKAGAHETVFLWFANGK